MKHKNGEWKCDKHQGRFLQGHMMAKLYGYWNTHFDINDQIIAEKALSDKSRQWKLLLKGCLMALLLLMVVVKF